MFESRYGVFIMTMRSKEYTSKSGAIQNNIINAIKEKLPPRANIANVLMNMLFIGKEAVYRRLRGEVPFSLEEIATISQTMGISIDNLLNTSTLKSKPFQLRLTEYINPGDADYAQLDEFNNLIDESRNDTYTEIGSSANIFPMTIFLNYNHLTKFFLFRWLYQWEGLDDIKSLDDIKITPRMEDIQKRYVEGVMHIKYTYYIWDYLIFQYLVNEIKYFASIRFITGEDVAALKEDILKFVDDMELLAAKGRYETGTKVQFYLSSINFENTYSYLQTDKYNLSHIKIFSLNGAVSLDEMMFLRLKKWIQSIKRLSTLISESGEMQRVQFFKEQRELINTM